MRHKEIEFRFHNPNNKKDTYNAVADIFAVVGCKKLQNALLVEEPVSEHTIGCNAILTD